MKVEPFTRSKWEKLPREGCINVEGRVLLAGENLFLIAQLRFGKNAEIDEHPGDSGAEVFCLEGKGFVSVGVEVSAFESGQRVRWPKGIDHKLWTLEDEMQVLIVHRESNEDE